MDTGSDKKYAAQSNHIPGATYMGSMQSTGKCGNRGKAYISDAFVFVQ